MTWPLVPFSQAVKDVSSGNVKILQSDFAENGTLPIIDQGQKDIAGYTSDVSAAIKTTPPVIVFGDHTRILKYVDFPFAMGADGVKVLKANPEFDPKFLFRFLQSVKVPSAGYSRHFKFLKETKVPLPPMAEQVRIAGILDLADEVLAKRRAALALLDALPQSLFHQMFGDPATNPQNFPELTLGSLAVRFSDGPFGSNLKSDHYTNNGIPVIRLQNIKVGEYDASDKAFVSEDHYATLAKHDCKPGDVIIGTLGEPNLRACIQPSSMPIALNKADCIQFRVNDKLANAQWACWLLNAPGTLALASSLAHGQTRTRIAMGKLRELKVPVPPLELQQEFARRVEAINAQRALLEQALAKDEELFASLQSRAFNGEL